MNKLIVFVGPNGAGKTTLMLELVRNLSDRLTIVKSLTSRGRRGGEDDLFYQFVPKKDIEKRKNEGRLLQVSEYAGNLYANDKADLDRLLLNKHGLISLIEESVETFRRAGYEVVVIRVIPMDNPKTLDSIRAAEDAKRAANPIKTDFELKNRFKPGGRERAIRELFDFIHRTVV